MRSRITPWLETLVGAWLSGSVIIFFVGYILGFCLGMWGKPASVYGGGVPGFYDGTPGGWVEYFKYEVFQKPLEPKITIRGIEAMDPIQHKILLFLGSPAMLGLLIGGCLGALVPAEVAFWIALIIALPMFSLMPAGTIGLILIRGEEAMLVTGGVLIGISTLSILGLLP